MEASKKVLFIRDWILNYTKSMQKKAQSLVIGTSGGIDSSVTSTLCAMTGLKTIVVSMPINQIASQHDLSLKHKKWLKDKFNNVESHTVKLDELFKSFQNMLSGFNSEHGLANSRARIRMTALYQVAAANNGIVVGTGNKIEDFGVGFFTKYGDGGVDISPIADLTKSEVYVLAKKNNIIDEIIEAQPTDGLWDDGRTDESQLGASYKELEWAMDWYENNSESISTKNLNKEQLSVLDIYLSHRKINKHKMQEIPVFKKNKQN